jgi:Outer membrane protein (OmpH-like).
MNARSAVLFTVLAGLSLTGLMGCDQQGAGKAVAIVDMDKIFKESSIGKQEAEHNKAVRDILTQAKKDAENRYGEMSSEEQSKSRNADAAILNQQWNAELTAARTTSLKTILKAVEAYRQEKKMTMILDEHQVIAFDTNQDVTQSIIDNLKTIHVDYGKLPQVTMREKQGK